MFPFRKAPSNPSPAFAGLVQAVGIFAYIMVGIGVGSSVLFQQMIPSPSPMLSGMLFLMIFSTSALVCATIALFYPVKFLLEKRVRDAVTVVLSMVAWMFVIILALMLLMTLMGGMVGGFAA